MKLPRWLGRQWRRRHGKIGHSKEDLLNMLCTLLWAVDDYMEYPDAESRQRRLIYWTMATMRDLPQDQVNNWGPTFAQYIDDTNKHLEDS